LFGKRWPEAKDVTFEKLKFGVSPRERDFVASLATVDGGTLSAVNERYG
jgi:hypothetical protein